MRISTLMKSIKQSSQDFLSTKHLKEIKRLLIANLLIFADVALLFMSMTYFGKLRGFILTALITILFLYEYKGHFASLKERLAEAALLLITGVMSIITLWLIGSFCNILFQDSDCSFEMTILEGAIVYGIICASISACWKSS